MSANIQAVISSQYRAGPAFQQMGKDIDTVGQKASVASGQFDQMGNSVVRASKSAGASLRNVQFQMIDMLQGIPLLIASPTYGLINLANQGAQISQAYSDKDGGAARGFKEAAGMAVRFAARLAPIGAVAALVGTSVAAMTTEINKSADTQVSVTQVMLASWQLFSEQVMSALSPVTDLLSNIWTMATPYIVNGINMAVGLFDLAARNIKTIWSELPNAIGDVVFQAAQQVANGVVFMVRSVGTEINALITDANGMLRKIGGPEIPTIGLPNYPTLTNPFKGGGFGIMESLSGNAQDVGAIVSDNGYTKLIGERAQQLSLADKLAEKVTKGATKASGAVEKLTDDTKAMADMALSAFSGLGSGIAEAFRKGGNVAEGVLNVIASKVSRLADMLLDSAVDGLLGNVFGSLFGSFKLPGFASGTMSAPAGLAMVGENGPELVRFRGGEQVIPNNRMGAALQSSGEISLVINNTIQVPRGATEADGAMFARSFALELRKQLPDAMARVQRNPDRRVAN